MFVFLANRVVPPTNNGSEQALHPCVIFRPLRYTHDFGDNWEHMVAGYQHPLEVLPIPLIRNVPNRSNG